MATFRYSISLRSERYETTPCRNITSHDARDKRRQHPDKQRYHYNRVRCRYGETGGKSVPGRPDQVCCFKHDRREREKFRAARRHQQQGAVEYKRS